MPDAKPASPPRWLKRTRIAIGALAVVALLATVVRAMGVEYRRDAEYVVAGDGRSAPTVLVQNTQSRRLVLGVVGLATGGAPYRVEVLDDLPADVSQAVLRSLTVTGRDGVLLDRKEVPLEVMEGETVGLHGDKSPARGYVYIDPAALSGGDASIFVDGSVSLLTDGGAREVHFARRFKLATAKGFVTAP